MKKQNKESREKAREQASIVSAQRILRKCGYDAGREQVEEEATRQTTQALAVHVVNTMKNKGFDQPRLINVKNTREFAKATQPLSPTFDPNDYESIQLNYEKY